MLVAAPGGVSRQRQWNAQAEDVGSMIFTPDGRTLVVAGGALLVAAALDSPVGEGSRDVAQPAVPGTVAEPEAPEGPRWSTGRRSPIGPHRVG